MAASDRHERLPGRDRTAAEARASGRLRTERTGRGARSGEAGGADLAGAPDESIQIADEAIGPEARYEQRETLELAFVARLDFQAQLDALCAKINGRVHRTTRAVVSEPLAAERELMRRLPA